MYAHGQTVIQLVEQLAPKKLAMEGDEARIGLQVGTLQKEVRRVMVALDVLEPVVDEAIAKNVDLIIAHHAVIFRPIQHVRTDLPQGRLLEKCLKHDIAVYVAHTNLDVAQGGLNDWLAEELGLQQTEVLIPLQQEKLKKIVVFIPTDHVEPVMDAMANAGAGWIGNYSHCTFQIPGTGTFMPREGTNPFIGQQGTLERVAEVRLETIVPESIQSRVIRAMLEAHPYEEVAYDVYPLEQEGTFYGLGRKGTLSEPMTLAAFAQKVKDVFGLKGLRYVGDPEKGVKTVGIIGGDGNRFIPQAATCGIDVLVTGDVYYHTAHEAMAAGLALVDPGHHVEQVMKRRLAAYLSEALAEKQWKTEVIVSEVNTDPFSFL
ncbi:MAG: Nif3-like dinuclear metal center hexameric protein [Bacillaceae bacterium G1]|nr:Nif3-like dinuclear metal center hexameric protein [Bacillota bacterium]OJF18014.1 MAG: Nif3-like dinuclear metal center hexameric protein [Bacillaceae bacterium G1]